MIDVAQLLREARALAFAIGKDMKALEDRVTALEAAINTPHPGPTPSNPDTTRP